jgi:fatty-acyl-CoA synthase
VVVTHRNLSANIDAFSGPAGVGSSPLDCAVSWLPMYHDMGLVGMAIGAVYGSLSAVLLTPQAFVKRPVDWLRAISRHRGTVSLAPNFAYELAARRVNETDLAGLGSGVRRPAKRCSDSTLPLRDEHAAHLATDEQNSLSLSSSHS